MDKKIWSVLKKVIDPELGINIVDLGLIYKVEEKEGKVNILMTLTSPGCPLIHIFHDQICGAVSKIKGIKEVKIKLTFDPVWTPEKMNEEARIRLGM